MQISYQILVDFVNLGYFLSVWGLGRHPLEPSGVPPAHSVSRGCIFLQNWVSKGSLGAPLGHSLGSLGAGLWPLWQHMVTMLVFRGTRGGFWRPNVLKVTSVHLVFCCINVVKTDVFTTCHLFCKFVPKSVPKRSQDRLWVTFWAHLGSLCRLFGELWSICGTLGGPLRI